MVYLERAIVETTSTRLAMKPRDRQIWRIRRPCEVGHVASLWAGKRHVQRPSSINVALLRMAEVEAQTRQRRRQVPTAPAGTLYRGREGMWSWVAHRITGALTFFFLFAHVLDTALVRVSPEAYDTVIATYKNPVVNLLEVGLVGAVLYHALNGVRVIAIDFWSKGPKYQQAMLWSIVAVWMLVMIPGVYFMLEHTVSAIFGGS